MKLAKSQLRKIIKEELEDILKEGSSFSPGHSQMPDVDKFVHNVATTGIPELGQARNVLVNKVGEVLVEKGWAGKEANLGDGNLKLKYMWDQMKHEKMRAPEYAALYWYLSSLFGTDTIAADFSR